VGLEIVPCRTQTRFHHEWEEPELPSQAFEAGGFKKDVPYAVHVV